MPIVSSPSAGGGSQPQPFACVTVASVDGIASGATIPFDTVMADADGFWDSVNHQFVVPAGKGGVYLMGIVLDVAGDGGLDPGATAAEVNGSFTGPLVILSYLPGTNAPNEYQGTATGVGIANDGETIHGAAVWFGAAATALISNSMLYVIRLGDAP